MREYNESDPDHRSQKVSLSKQEYSKLQALPVRCIHITLRSQFQLVFFHVFGFVDASDVCKDMSSCGALPGPQTSLRCKATRTTSRTRSLSPCVKDCYVGNVTPDEFIAVQG